jgi:hypothetical protein
VRAKGDHLRSGAYHEFIRQEVPEEVLALLSQMGHFRKAYEINEDRRISEGSRHQGGTSGLEGSSHEWRYYRAVEKTLSRRAGRLLSDLGRL